MQNTLYMFVYVTVKSDYKYRNICTFIRKGKRKNRSPTKYVCCMKSNRLHVPDKTGKM